MATTSSVSSDTIFRNPENKKIQFRVIKMSYIDDTGGDDFSLKLDNDDWTGQGSTGKLGGTIFGWCLYSVAHIPNADGPTDDSDLTVIHGSATNAPDLLQGSGTDMMDEAVGRIVYPQDANGDGQVLAPIYDQITFAIANNSVDGGGGTLEVVLIPMNE